MLTIRWTRCIRPVSMAGLFALVMMAPNTSSAQDFKGKGKAKLPDFVPADYDDYQNMLDRLGIKKMRRGRDARVKDTSDEATANPFKDSMPAVLTFKEG